MKNALFAVVAAGALAGLANADVVISFGDQSYGGGDFQSVTSPGLTGTLTGMIISFQYEPLNSDTFGADVAGVVGTEQWGGYNNAGGTLIGGATVRLGGNGLPPLSGPWNFTSGVLSLTNTVFNGETTNVTIGNGYLFGAFDLSNATITLVGVNAVPTPGAAAVLGLAGLAGFRRRR
ncbi:MAG: MYXO-CTERM sorting domain-containing protein [Phycisphaerales bacterium]